MNRFKSAVVAMAVAASALAFANPAGADTQVSLDPTFDNGTGYDGRGDLMAAGGGYTDDRAYVAVTRRTHDVPTGTNWSDYTTGVLWHVDVNLDGQSDYDVFFISLGTPTASVHDSNTDEKICDADTSWPTSSSGDGSGHLFAHFNASCIGSPAAFRVHGFMVYSTPTSSSSDLAPNSGWAPTITRTVTSQPDPQPQPNPQPQPQPQPDPTLTSAGTGSGYWMVTDDGQAFNFGDAQNYGSDIARTVKRVDIKPTPSGKGYWILAESGAVHNKGDAKWLGSALNSLQPGETAAAISSTPLGDGYWIFTSRGRVLTFGAAQPFGDMSGVTLNGPVLDAIATPAGDGYWMVASDGGVFTFGNAKFSGSTGNLKLNKPVMSMAPDPDGSGYWLVASDGGIFAFDALFYGSMGGTPLNKPVSGIVPGSGGYMMVGEDGGIFSFGSVKFHGSLGANPPSRPVVAVALMP
jgi:hypothetical protein